VATPSVLAVPELGPLGIKRADMPKIDAIPRLEAPFTATNGIHLVVETIPHAFLINRAGETLFHFGNVLLKMKDGLEKEAVKEAFRAYLSLFNIRLQDKGCLLMWALWSWFELVKTDFDPATISDPPPKET
jgi:hypothetical protein